MFKSFSTFWYKHGFNLLVVVTILFFLLYWLFFTRHRQGGTYSSTYYYNPRTGSISSEEPVASYRKKKWGSRPNSPRQVTQTSKGEVICKNYVEYLFERPFIKCRPSFLYNTVTHENLELDCYNADLRLAIEYNGRQHYEYVPFLHGNSRTNFHNQKYRDEKKKEMCQKQGIYLITVPYTVPHDKIPSFLKDEITRLRIPGVRK